MSINFKPSTTDNHLRPGPLPLAPTEGSVGLAGILLKTGACGLIRLGPPLFAQQLLAFAPIAIALGVAGIIYGAVLAITQTEFKRLLIYSSIAHMGYLLSVMVAGASCWQRPARIRC